MDRPQEVRQEALCAAVEARQEEERKKIEKHLSRALLLARRYACSYSENMNGDDFESLAYWTVLTQLPRFNGKGSEWGWLCYKLKRNFADLLRKENPHWRMLHLLPLQSVKPLLLSTNGEALKQMEQQQFIRHLMRRAGLKAKEVKRLSQYYYEGLTKAEIAREECVTESAISASIRRALIKLRGELDCQGVCLSELL